MAIFYDFIEAVGGAERVTINLANSVKQAIVVSGVNKESLQKLPFITTSLINISSLSSFPIWKSFKSMYAFKRYEFCDSNDEVNLFSGSNALLAVNKSQALKNYYYCHTPPRFAYDLYEYYQKTLPWYQALIIKLFAIYVRSQYKAALAKMDAVFANSKNVQARLKHYLDINSEVIYPPVDIDKYYYKEPEGFYLSISRLEDYKRVELIVDAFIEMPNQKLRVISGGSLFTHLKKKSFRYNNIEIIGWVSSDELIEYVAKCIATIYIPIDEDFGMSPIESMAAGKPVIGVNEGGVAETVIDKKTGVLCPKNPTVENVKSAVNSLSPEIAINMRYDCERRASDFSSEYFYKRMKQVFEISDNT